LSSIHYALSIQLGLVTSDQLRDLILNNRQTFGQLNLNFLGLNNDMLEITNRNNLLNSISTSLDNQVLSNLNEHKIDYLFVKKTNGSSLWGGYIDSHKGLFYKKLTDDQQQTRQIFAELLFKETTVDVSPSIINENEKSKRKESVRIHDFLDPYNELFNNNQSPWLIIKDLYSPHSHL